MINNSSILSLNIYDYLVNDNHNINDEILYKLRDLFFVNKNYELYSLINKEISGTFTLEFLPDYRKTKHCEINGFSGSRGMDSQLFKEHKNSEIGILCKLQNQEDIVTDIKDIYHISEKDKYVLLNGENISECNIKIKFSNIIMNFKKNYLTEVKNIIIKNFDNWFYMMHIQSGNFIYTMLLNTWIKAKITWFFLFKVVL